MDKQEHYTLKEAAERLGVSPITLKRWLLSQKVAEVARNRNGWRLFTSKDIDRIRRFAEKRLLPKKS
jgi:DNA-binding transcriptional MerR regulator